MSLRDAFKFDADERAVSPVIGVILMVAITVILAAVIASMTLGLGDSAQTAPQAKLDQDYTQNFDNAASTNDNLALTHQSGATLPADRVKVVVTGARLDSDPAAIKSTIAGADGEVTWDDLASGSPTEIGAGDSITLDQSDFEVTNSGTGDNLDLSGATVKLVWTSEDGGTSDTLMTWTAS